MLRNLLILFIVVPLVELAILTHIGTRFGLWPTIGLILVTGVAGAMLAKRQGLSVLRRLREQLARGASPADALIDGALVLVASALLVTPGLLTDAVGLGLLVPPLRAHVRRAVRRRLLLRFRIIEL